MTDEHVAPNGIQKRKKRNESITVDPTDILLGRGKSFKNHPGNILFQGTLVPVTIRHAITGLPVQLMTHNLTAALSFHTEIINQNRERYFETKSHREKRELTSGIVKSICEDGRFLKRDKHTWKEASFETARQKVAHAMQYRQRCLTNTTPLFDDEVIEDDASVASSRFRSEAQKYDGSTTIDRYSTSDIDGKLQRREAFASSSSEMDSQQLILENTSTNTDTYPANLRVVSDVMGLHVSNPTYCQQFRSTHDTANNNCFYTHEQDNLTDLVLSASSDRAQLFPVPVVGNSEAFLLKSIDEQSSSSDVPIPLPLQSMLRGTSDFSFGDFSLNGEFMTTIEDGDHENIYHASK